MVVDLEFELSYVLTDELGVGIGVKGYSFDESTGKLCVSLSIEGVGDVEACTTVKQCRGISDDAKLTRCLAKALLKDGRSLRELVDEIKKVVQA